MRFLTHSPAVFCIGARGRIIEQRDPGEAVKRFTYDAMGNRIRFTLHRNNLVEPEISLWYTYDELNRVIAVQKDDALIAAYSYDLRGNRTLQKYPTANLETSYGYNLAGLMTELYNRKNGKVVSQFKYTYDIDGNQLTKLNGELETAYEYDKLGRLIAEREVNGNTYLYGYDAFSNRSSLTVSGYDNYSTTYEYDLNNRLLTEIRVEKDFTEKSAYTYDKNGNQIRRTIETIEGKKPWPPPERHLFITAPKEKSRAKIDVRKYNGFGQLMEVYRDGQRINFRYRPDSLRHSKEVTYPFKPSLNRSTTHFWDGQNIVLELNGNGAIKAKYLRGAQLIAQVIGAELFYYLHNAHGDVVQRIAENGTSAPQYKYDAFGNQIAPSYAPRILSAFSKLRFNQLCFSFGAGELDPNPFRYCGEYFDSETGELYLRARYYDSGTGHFTTEDTVRAISCKSPNGEDITDPRSLNYYTYCANNPVMYLDPSGHAWWHWAIAAAVVVTLAVVVVVTAGGAAPAIMAVASVSCGVAAPTMATTVAAGAFIGASTALGGSALYAATNSSTVEEFCDQGDWGTVGVTVGGATVGAAYGYGVYQSSNTHVPEKGYSGDYDPNKNFRNGNLLEDHFNRHGTEMGYNTASEYATGAENFLFKDTTTTTEYFTSPDGWYFRYDTATGEFGIMNEYGGISTFFKASYSYWLEQIRLYNR